MRVYRRKTAKIGPLNGGPAKREAKGKKKKEGGQGTWGRADPDDCRVNANV